MMQAGNAATLIKHSSEADIDHKCRNPLKINESKVMGRRAIYMLRDLQWAAILLLNADTQRPTLNYSVASSCTQLEELVLG